MYYGLWTKCIQIEPLNAIHGACKRTLPVPENVHLHPPAQLSDCSNVHDVTREAVKKLV